MRTIPCCPIGFMLVHMSFTQALKASSEEFARILDIMGKYAAYKAGVALSCKRQVSYA